MQKVNQFRGYWKFKMDRVTLEELEQVAKEFAQDPRYLSVYIREVSKNQLGIGYIYDPEDSSQAGFDAYHDKTSDMLLKKFGNGLAGWDYSGWYYSIK